MKDAGEEEVDFRLTPVARRGRFFHPRFGQRLLCHSLSLLADTYAVCRGGLGLLAWRRGEFAVPFHSPQR